MSITSNYIPYPGAEPIPTHINTVSDEDRAKDFRCDGKVLNKICNAPQCPQLGKFPRFRLRDPQRDHHIPGCPNDESADALRIDHLDQTGRHTTSRELLARLCHNPQTRTKTAPPRDTPMPYGAQDSGALTLDTRPHRYGSRPPDTLRQAIVLWSTLPVDAPYADTTVGDLLIDQRNIRDYRANGVPSGRIAVILCAKIGTKTLDRVVPARVSSEIVLRDAYAYRDKTQGLLISFKADAPARNAIFKAEDKIIAIMAQWMPHPTIPGAYTATDIIRKGNLCFFAYNFFDDNI